MPRMQDFAPITPELLGALSGPQTPGREGHLAMRGAPSHCRDLVYAKTCRSMITPIFIDQMSTLIKI